MRARILRCFTILALMAGLSAHAAQPAASFQVICNPQNTITGVDRHFLEDAFLKRITTWPSGAPLRPVDLAANSPVRRQFSDQVLKRPVEAVKSYWLQRVFSGGELPPVEFAEESQVVSYVLANPSAIGYVSSGTPLNGAKVLPVGE